MTNPTYKTPYLFLSTLRGSEISSQTLYWVWALQIAFAYDYLHYEIIFSYINELNFN